MNIIQQNSTVKINSDLIFENMFSTLTALYPSIKSQLTEQNFNELKNQWIIALRENGINRNGLINTGIARTRREKREFLPPVGVFIEWCKYEYVIQKYNIPSVNELLLALKHYSAMHGVAEYRSTSKAKYYLVTGLYSHVKAKQLSEEKTLKLAESMINELIDLVNNGFEIPDITRSIESKNDYKPLAASEALQRIASIKNMLRGRAHEVI